MAMLKKMVVQGIRSFDPKEQQAIQFYSPLTLIVGQNGCGKTTVIEALKFSITGETPPNTKGGCFLNDPKLGHGYETKASVMTEVRDRSNTKIVITRRLRAQAKGDKGAVSVSTLEGTIQTTKVDPRTKESKNSAVTNKCVDLKEEMCRVMGVSDSILNNVIFCHQEDSCWPLDEASKVKQKFDAIFNTTMYIKALKELEKSEKTLREDLRNASTSLTHTTINLQQLRRKQSEYEDLQTQLRVNTDEIAELERSTEPLTRKIEELEKLIQNYADVSSKVKEKRAVIQQLEIENTSAQRGLKDKEKPEGSSEELDSQINNFSRIFKSKQDVCDKVGLDIRRKVELRKNIDEKLKSLISQSGSFDAKKKQNDKNQIKISQLISNFVSKVKEIKENSVAEDFSENLSLLLDSYSVEPNSIDPTSTLRALSDAVQMKEKEYKGASATFEEREKEIESKIEATRDKLVQLTTENQSKDKEMKELDKEIKVLDSRLRDLEESNERLANLKESEDSLSSTIQSIETSGVIPRYKKEIEALKDELRKLEEQKKQLESYQTILSNDAKYSGQIQARMEAKHKKEVDSKELFRSRIEPKLRNLSLEVDSSKPIGKLISSKTSELEKESKIKEKDHAKVLKEITESESKLKHITKDLESKEKEIKTLRSRLTRIMENPVATDNDSFDEEYTEIFEKTDKAQEDYLYGDAAKFLYKRYLKSVQKKPCCPLCKRGFQEEEEKENLIEVLNKSISDIDTGASNVKEKFETLKSRQQVLLDFKPSYDKLVKFESSEVPELKKTKALLEKNLVGLKEQFGELTDSWDLIKNDLKLGRELTLSAGTFDGWRDEIKRAEDQIHEIERKRDPSAKSVPMSLDDVQNELENLGTIINSKSREREDKERIKESKQASLQKSKDEKIRVSEKILSITSELQGKVAMEEQKDALEKKRINLKVALGELAKKIPPLQREIDNEKCKLDEVKKERKSTLEQIKKEETDLEKWKDGILSLQRDISEFTKIQKIFEETVLRKMTTVEQEMEKITREIKELEEERDTLVQDVASGETQLLNLKTWKQIKDRESRIQALQSEIEVQESNIQASRARGTDHEYRALLKRRQAIYDKTSSKSGALVQLRNTVAGVNKELTTEPFKSAEVKHREALVKKTVYEKAMKDVRIYRMALDNAVMAYHHKKMETINKYLSFYWKKIYKGNDIETIEIRTENEDTSGKEKGSKVKIDMNKTQRKVYNYRVVMIRRGIDLDMRGRCSAGQKVLASIIIRLALAQTFGTKCGIIALDEPTTNLDQKNINSLAQTLSELALTMSDTKTFQLIVITHDQDFIDTLLRVDPVEYYFRVSRNQMGYSQIEKITK